MIQQRKLIKIKLNWINKKLNWANNILKFKEVYIRLNSLNTINQPQYQIIN